MILHEVPTPDEVRADLDDVLGMIWQALEVGVGSAVDFFVSHGLTEPDDRGLAAHLTRYQAKQVLDGLQQDATFEREDLPFSGLLLRVIRNGRNYVIRIRRSMDGLLPLPQSDLMEAFYWQPELPLEGQTTQPPSAEIHLMVLWTTTNDYSQVSSLKRRLTTSTSATALPMMNRPENDLR